MAPRSEQPDVGDRDWDGPDPEDPQECDLSDDEDETATVPCPHCRRPVPDFIDRCPYCRDWIMQSAGEPRRHLGFALFVLLAGVVLLIWALR